MKLRSAHYNCRQFAQRSQRTTFRQKRIYLKSQSCLHYVALKFQLVLGTFCYDHTSIQTDYVETSRFGKGFFFCLHWASSYYVLQNGKKRNWNCMNVIEALCNLNKTWMNGIERERRAWILNSLKFDPVLPLSEIQLGKIVLWTTLPYWKRICRTANVAWTIQKRDERSANCLPL